MDVIISAVVFLIFVRRESQRYRMRNWWVYALAALAVGPSFALPLFLAFREPRVRAK